MKKVYMEKCRVMLYSSHTSFVYVKFRLRIFVTHLDTTYFAAYRSIRELQKKCHMTRVAGEPRQDYSFILVRNKMSCACKNGAQCLFCAPEHPINITGATMDIVFVHLLVGDVTPPDLICKYTTSQ